jgi:glycosyltransferase involved in cell wall biosynthesis
MNDSLHVLWTGSMNGGAQEVAVSLAKRNETLTTTSIRSGDLRSSFLSKNLKFVSLTQLVTKKWNKVIASDYRAFLFILIARVVFFRDAPVFAIIHSNRKKKLDFLLLRVLRFLLNKNDRVLVSTEDQKCYLSNFLSSNLVEVARIFDIQSSGVNKPRKPKFDEPINVMFFGRLSPEKRIDKFLRAIPNNSIRKYFLFGDGDRSLLRGKHPNLVQNIGWHKLENTIHTYDISYVCVPNKFEGISLVTLQGILNGIVPITAANSAFSTLCLPDYLRWDCRDIEGFICRLEMKRKRIDILTDCLRGVREYQDKYKMLDEYIFHSGEK